MARYAQVNDVSMWYDRRGAGEPVVLLHGGFTDSRDFDGNLAGLADAFTLYLPERRGHGHTADVEGPISVSVMARDTIAFVESVVGGPTDLVGYSAGAAVALRAAVDRPDLVRRLVLVSGSFRRDGMLVLPSGDGEMPPPLVQRYAEVSPDGAAHLKVVLAKVVRSIDEEPDIRPDELAKVESPTLVMAGDDDLVRLEHTVELYQALPAGQLAVVPNASHLLLHEQPDLCTGLVREFLRSGIRPTMMPIRRAAHG